MEDRIIILGQPVMYKGFSILCQQIGIKIFQGLFYKDGVWRQCHNIIPDIETDEQRRDAYVTTLSMVYATIDVMEQQNLELEKKAADPERVAN